MALAHAAFLLYAFALLGIFAPPEATTTTNDESTNDETTNDETTNNETTNDETIDVVVNP